MKKSILAFISLVVFMTSCSHQTFYQVYEVLSPDVTVQENILLYENSDCSISYNLWSNGGNLNFLFTNKTDQNMFIVMPKSFFVLNGVANDYYSDSSHSLSVTKSMAANSTSSVAVNGYLSNGFFWYPSTISRHIGATAGLSRTETVKTNEMPIICIPPKSSKFIKGFNLSDYVNKDCENRKMNYPSRTSPKVSFNMTNSPLVFRNRIAYTFDEKSSDVKYIENKFFVISYLNYSEKSAFEVKKEKNCDNDFEVSKKYFKMSAPNKFYNTYMKKYQ